MLGSSFALAWLSFKTYIDKPEFLLADVRGLNREEATRLLESQGFKVSLEAVSSYEAQADTILSSRPPANSNLRQGHLIHLGYALPDSQNAMVITPGVLDFKGETSVREALKAAGLGLISIYAHSSLEKDRVIAQSPSAGAFSSENGSVKVIFSAGPASEKTYVTDLRGLKLEDVFTVTDLWGLINRVEIDYLEDSVYLEGTVIEQYIKPGQLIDPEHSVLRLLVSGSNLNNDTPSSTSDNSNALEIMPNFVGLSLTQAEALAKSYNISIRQQILSSPNLIASVISQDPPPYSSLSDKVTLYVNQFAASPPQETAPTQTTLNLSPLTSSLATSQDEGTINSSVSGGPSDLSYFWTIANDRPQQLAEVTAVLEDGQRFVIYRQWVQGGDEVKGTWVNPYDLSIRFELSLNGQTIRSVIEYP
ncbi:MAG: PASTA domain-containing protein [Deinococcales bacterium]